MQPAHPLALLLALAGSLPGPQEDRPAAAAAPPNVLLLCVDDLRPELGCFGAAHAVSPEIDRLARSGRRFTRHFVQFPTCGASRAALLTGRGPRRPAHWGNGAFGPLREEPRVTLPQAFRAAGYRTVCLGKVSHSHDGRRADGEAEVPEAWDALPTDPGEWKHARHLLHAYADGAPRERGKSPLTQFREGPDETYPDGILALQAVAQLGELAEQDAPFFLAVGFYKPHLPFCAPRKYWDLFADAELPLAELAAPPADLGAVHACRQSGEVTGNYTCPQWEDRRWSAEEQRELLRAYLACVAYVDAQIGKVLRALEDLELARDTVVVLWGDHGWHLGEQGLMGKHTTFEAALRSPLIVRLPGDERAGAASERLVASIDLFPTLCDLAGVDAPNDLDGLSFASEWRAEDAPAARDAVPSYWRAAGHLGYVLRTDRWRFVRWVHPESGDEAAVELYDLHGAGEARNVAAQHPEVVARLRARVERDR